MKQAVLVLYGSLTFGLVVALFGTFEPEYFSITSHENCEYFNKPILVTTTEMYKIEKIGLCAGFDTLYKFTSITNPEFDDMSNFTGLSGNYNTTFYDVDLSQMPDIAAGIDVCPNGTVLVRTGYFEACMPSFDGMEGT